MNLENTLVIAITSTALFDLSAEDENFNKAKKKDPVKAVISYRKNMQKCEKESLEEGTGFALVKALLNLNKYSKDDTKLIEVVIMSRNSPETGFRIFHNIRRHNLDISRSVFTGGSTVVDYIEPYDVDLFLTTDENDAQKVRDLNPSCAVALLKQTPKKMKQLKSDEVRIAFDGDAVLFDEKSELTYKKEGIEAFHKKENEQQNIPLEDGPYATFLKKLSNLQKMLPSPIEKSPIRLAIVTARNMPAEMRVIKTLRHWDVYINEIFFLGGLSKSSVLEVFAPHIFFDDQDTHLEEASKLVPSAKVPHKSNSSLKEYEK